MVTKPVFVTDPTNPDPFDAPPPAGGFLKDYVDRLVLVTPVDTRHNMATKVGVKETVVIVDYVVLAETEDQEDEAFAASLVFNELLVRDLTAQMRTKPGRPLLARMRAVENKKGKDPVAVFEAFTEADKNVAVAYLARQAKAQDDFPL